jgi:hypothetical protein
MFQISLATPFSQGIVIFPKKNELIFLGKNEISWENGIVKISLQGKIAFR